MLAVLRLMKREKRVGLLDRDIAWRGSFQNLVDERCDLAKSTVEAGPVCHQATLSRRMTARGEMCLADRYHRIPSPD